MEGRSAERGGVGMRLEASGPSVSWVPSPGGARGPRRAPRAPRGGGGSCATPRGGGAPCRPPRHVKPPPFFQFKPPDVWTTLELTIRADGTSDFALAGASMFPRHWVYDAEGKLAAK